MFPQLRNVPERCDKKGCPNPPSWRVGFQFLPTGHPKPWTDCHVGLYICNTCKLEMKIEDLVQDEAWGKIVCAFRKMGKADPDRASLRLMFDVITRLN